MAGAFLSTSAAVISAVLGIRGVDALGCWASPPGPEHEATVGRVRLTAARSRLPPVASRPRMPLADGRTEPELGDWPPRPSGGRPPVQRSERLTSSLARTLASQRRGPRRFRQRKNGTNRTHVPPPSSSPRSQGSSFSHESASLRSSSARNCGSGCGGFLRRYL